MESRPPHPTFSLQGLLKDTFIELPFPIEGPCHNILQVHVKGWFSHIVALLPASTPGRKHCHLLCFSPQYSLAPIGPGPHTHTVPSPRRSLGPFLPPLASTARFPKVISRPYCLCSTLGPKCLVLALTSDHKREIGVASDQRRPSCQCVLGSRESKGRWLTPLHGSCALITIVIIATFIFLRQCLPL